MKEIPNFVPFDWAFEVAVRDEQERLAHLLEVACGLWPNHDCDICRVHREVVAASRELEDDLPE